MKCCPTRDDVNAVAGMLVEVLTGPKWSGDGSLPHDGLAPYRKNTNTGLVESACLPDAVGILIISLLSILLSGRAMTVATITLSSKGQIVIPKDIRDELHWEPGLELTIETTESGVLLKSKPMGKKLRLEDLRGFLKYGGPSIPTEELCKPPDYSADWEESEKRSR